MYVWTDSRRENSKKELMIINNEKCVLLSRKIKPVQNAYKGKEGVHLFSKGYKK